MAKNLSDVVFEEIQKLAEDAGLAITRRVSSPNTDSETVILMDYAKASEKGVPSVAMTVTGMDLLQVRDPLLLARARFAAAKDALAQLIQAEAA